MRLTLIRHGQTPNNVTGALDTAVPGAGLTALGREQAEAIPAALADRSIDAVFVSSLVRTSLTAAPLARARSLPITVRAGLEEISAGQLELRSDDEAKQQYTACVDAWLAGDLDRTVPGGDPGTAFLDRFDAALRAIAAQHADGEVTVFAHGAAIRVYVAIRAGLPEAQAHRLDNTGSAQLEGDPDRGWELRQWHPEPLGGAYLSDRRAHDVTGDGDR